MKKIIKLIYAILAEKLPSGSIVKRVLKKIYWFLPCKLRTSNLTPHVLAALASQSQKKFIQIGVNDGISHDPLYPYLAETRWIGLMIEPNVKMMEVLQENHKETSSELTFVNKAIGEGIDPVLYLTDYNTGFASFDKEHVIKHIGLDKANSIKTISVDLITFGELIHRYPKFQQCDLLLIDTEGYDAKIIQSIDFDSFHADVIIFEKVHIVEVELNSVTRLLEKKGYTIFDCRFDRLAIFTQTSNKALQTVLSKADTL